MMPYMQGAPGHQNQAHSICFEDVSMNGWQCMHYKLRTPTTTHVSSLFVAEGQLGLVCSGKNILFKSQELMRQSSQGHGLNGLESYVYHGTLSCFQNPGTETWFTSMSFSSFEIQMHMIHKYATPSACSGHRGAP
jgi:hypothetical protein